ncbi:MAG: S41 family peptidase [Tepidisphaeraceae bacterium]
MSRPLDCPLDHAARRENFGFQRVERLAGNVGYINMSAFHRPEFAGETVGAAMTFLANTDALIIDLRTSRGGSPDMTLFLVSYFFPGEEQVYLGGWYSRAENFSQQWWTLPYVPGPRYLDKDVYVLVSGTTFSAPEGLAAFMQHHKRARVVGEPTIGGSHPGLRISVHPNFALFVPAYRAVYPTGKPTFPLGRPIYPETRVDVKGDPVQPDLPVAANKALNTAHVEALKKRAAASPQRKEELTPIIQRLTEELQRKSN